MRKGKKSNLLLVVINGIDLGIEAQRRGHLTANGFSLYLLFSIVDFYDFTSDWPFLARPITCNARENTCTRRRNHRFHSKISQDSGLDC